MRSKAPHPSGTDEWSKRRYEFETYKKFSLAFYTILMAYADELQAVSVDEALIDVSGRVLALSQAPTAFQDLSEPEKFSVVDGVGLDVDGLPSSGVDHEAHTDSSRKLPKDWAKELAEKIRADVRAATGCEGEFDVVQFGSSRPS